MPDFARRTRSSPATPDPPPRKGFRDDIQGMRALAVLGIMVFHAGIAPYSGGFVTLDVFFVLSGFLIASLLYREIRRTGTVDLRDFYARRARRILPAATVTTVGTLLASYLWLSLVEAQDAAWDGVWAAFFGANVRFALEETDYFAQDEPASPLQHYWSLAVEEQFYLVLPAVLLLCVLVARRRQLRSLRTVAVVLAVVTAASLAWSVHASTVSPETAYFSTFTRTWEFGGGALLALAAPVLARRLTDVHRGLLAVAGLAMIAVACFVVTEATPFPGYAALLPVLGTAAVVLAGAELGARRPPVVQRLLGVAPLRVVGDASYSLYLWHWPVLVVMESRVGRGLFWEELGLYVVVTAALTWASYRFVETPLRRGMPPRLGRGLVLYPAALALVVGSAVVSVTVIQRELERGNPPIDVADYTRTPDGRPLSPDRAVAMVEASARAALDGAPVPGGLRPGLLDLKGDEADLAGCDYRGSDTWRLCRRGDRDADRTLVVLGNSHARHWIPAFEELAKEHGFATYYLVKSKCTAARVETVLTGQDEPWQECTDFNAWAQRQVEKLQPNLLVVSTTGVPGAWVDGEVVTEFERLLDVMRGGYDDLLADVVPHAGRVALLSDVPRRPGSPGECLSSRGATLRQCLARPVERAARVAEASRHAARTAGADVVDPTRWFCADGLCPAVIGDVVPMRDQGHVTTVYAAQLASPLARALGVG